MMIIGPGKQAGNCACESIATNELRLWRSGQADLHARGRRRRLSDGLGWPGRLSVSTKRFPRTPKTNVHPCSAANCILCRVYPIIWELSVAKCLIEPLWRPGDP